jgi:hypothetical protein
MDINQQQHLANFAPKQSLDKYSKGADPRVISGIVALSEMQEQAAMRQRANLASGAASGQMPTVRDKIMSLFQQSNPQQAQMQPNPMQQGIAARAHPNLQTAPMPDRMPQEAPEEMYSGGVARLPVRDDMFGYAGGGIIAFSNKGSVPKAEDADTSDEDKKLSPEEALEIFRDMQDRTATPRNPNISQEARPMPPVPTVGRNMPGGITTLDDRPMERVAAPAPTPSVPRSQMPESSQSIQEQIAQRGEQLRNAKAATVTEEPAPTGKPQLQKPRIIVDEKAAAEQARLAALHDKFKAGETLPTPPGIKSLPAAKPPGAKPSAAATPAKEAAPAQDQESKLMDMMMKQFGPQPAVETTEQRLAARDKYIEKAPTAPEALALLKHYDNMAKRYAANDEEEKAQQAINARNNLWTFLSNTRGSSLGVAAGKANAALQPLLSAQETRRQTYQKQRDEQEMLLGKARYEIANAERARKEGRYADAEKSELEAKKLQEQARGHNIQGLGSLINAAGTREQRRLDRDQQYLMHTERMSQLKLDRERMQAEATERRESQDRTQRENAYGRQSAKLKEAIQKAQKMLDLPDLPKDMKQRAEVALERLQKEDNDLYERIVVRGDKDYRPSPTVPGGNSALTSKADKIVGVK